MTTPALIRRQLKSRSIDTIHSGLSAVSSDQAAGLLEGVTVVDGAVVLNRAFESGEAAAPYRMYAVLRLLVLSGAPQCADITEVALRFTTTEPGALDAAFLSALPALDTLALRNAGGLSALPPLPGLRSLSLSGACGLDLAAVLSVPLRSLRLAGPPLDDDARATLRAQPGLDSLYIEGCAGLADLAELPPAATLVVRDCPDLAEVGALRATMLKRLDLRASVASVTIDDAPLLESLRLSGPALAGTLRAPSLTELRCDTLDDPAPLAALDKLQDVAVETWPTADLAPLTSPALSTLALAQAPTLADLSALSNKPSLQHVDIHGAEGLTELAPLASCASLRVLVLEGLGQLASAEGLRDSPALEELRLVGCGLLQEVDALETVSTLRRLDVTGCIGLRQIEGVRALPQLEEVVLPTGRGRSTRVYQGEDLAGLRERLQASWDKRQALEDGDPMVIRVRKLLMHEDLYHQRQALEVMRSFGPDFIDEVLGDCRIEDDGELFTPFGEPSESLLLALAESGKVPRPMRRLVLRGSRFGRLDVLKQLTDLEELTLSECPQLASLDGIEHCQKLRTLTITHCHRLRDITALRWARSLESLSIRGRAVHRGMMLAPQVNTAALRALATLVYLEHLDISGCGTLELGVLAELKRLRTLKAAALNPPEGLGRVSHLTRLEDVEILDCEKLEDVYALKQMPRLRRLILSNTQALWNLEPIGGLTELEELNIGGEGIRDAGALRNLTKLRFLALERCSALGDLSFLADLGQLETLYLDGAPILSLHALSSQGKLRRLTVQNLGQLFTLDGIESCAGLQTVEIQPGCGALRYADALLDLPALKRLVFFHGDPLQVPPEDRDRPDRSGAVRVGPYRARLRAALVRRQRITCEALRAVLDAEDAGGVAKELDDLADFQDPRLIDALLKGTRAGAGGAPQGGMLGGGRSTLANHALVSVLKVAIALGHAGGRTLAEGLSAPIQTVDGRVVPAELL